VRRWTVDITAHVRDQITEQVLYTAADSIDNALAWEDRLCAAIGQLAWVTGFAIDEDASDRLGFALHKLVFERTYLIHYELDDPANTVHVTSFRHGAREPKSGEP
jgi:hypothetical protein